jgi:hypothetical protein
LSDDPRATRSTRLRDPISEWISGRSGSRASRVRRAAAGCSAISLAIWDVIEHLLTAAR